jgi:hypothetical protein
LNVSFFLFLPGSCDCYKPEHFRFLPTVGPYVNKLLSRLVSSEIWHHVVYWQSTDISEKHITSMFRFR